MCGQELVVVLEQLSEEHCSSKIYLNDGSGIPNQMTGVIGVYKMSVTWVTQHEFRMAEVTRGYYIEGFDTKEQADQVDASS